MSLPSRPGGALPLQYPLTIFYDASCPMCANEMRALRALDYEGRLELVDCSAPQFDAGSLGAGVAQAKLMARIHARDGDGRWLVGVDVFEAAYRAAGLSLPARIWGNRLLRPLWNALYPRIADHRQLLSRLGISALIRWMIPRPAPQGPRCVGEGCALHRNRLSAAPANPRDESAPPL